MPHGPARSRLTAGLAVLALALGPASGGETGPARSRPICFATDPPNFVVVLEVAGQGATSSRLLGFLRDDTAPFPALPVTGAARLRDDGDLDFAVLGGGLPTPSEIYVRGRLNAPDFDSGSGTVLNDNPFLLSVPDTVDFVAAPCPTVVGDLP